MPPLSRDEQLAAAGYVRMPNGEWYSEQYQVYAPADLPVGAIVGQWRGGYLLAGDDQGHTTVYGTGEIAHVDEKGRAIGTPMAPSYLYPETGAGPGHISSVTVNGQQIMDPGAITLPPSEPSHIAAAAAEQLTGGALTPLETEQLAYVTALRPDLSPADIVRRLRSGQSPDSMIASAPSSPAVSGASSNLSTLEADQVAYVTSLRPDLSPSEVRSRLRAGETPDRIVSSPAPSAAITASGAHNGTAVRAASAASDVKVSNSTLFVIGILVLGWLMLRKGRFA